MHDNLVCTGFLCMCGVAGFFFFFCMRAMKTALITSLYCDKLVIQLLVLSHRLTHLFVKGLLVCAVMLVQCKDSLLQFSTRTVDFCHPHQFSRDDTDTYQTCSYKCIQCSSSNSG